MPVVVLIHGGFWRSQYTKMLMNKLARSVTDHGWAAWNIEYRRMGPLGGGGGWPETFVDVAAAIDHLAEIDAVSTHRVVTCGHSAGGHLALWAAARPRLPAGAPGDGSRVRPTGAVSLAGVTDLREADTARLGADAVASLLGGHWEGHAERYAQASPAELLPLGVPQVLVHGLDDTVVPPSMSENYQLRAAKLGDPVSYVPVEATAHRDLIDPASRAWEVTTAEIGRLVS